MDFHQPLSTQEICENDSDLIGLLLSSKQCTLDDEDRRILENRELLKYELRTLQNANADEINNLDSQVRIEITENETTRTEQSSEKNSDNELNEFELLNDPSSVDQNNYDPCRTDAITSIIQDQRIKDRVEELNVKIEINLLRCRELAAEAKNLFMQKVNLQRKLSKIDNDIKNYDFEEAKLKKLKKKRGTDSAYTGVTRLTYFCRFGMPYFKTGDYFNADRNSDYYEIARSDQKMLNTLPKMRRFLPQDGRKLIERVLAQLKTKRLAKLKQNLKLLMELNKGQEDVIAEQKRNILTAIADTEKVKSLQETMDWNIEVDFMSLESTRYSSEDYERVWNLMAKPTLSKNEFCHGEMNKLKALVEKYGAQDWDRLAELLNSNRSGFMCFTKYMIMEKRGRNSPWTAEEDTLLSQLCSKLKYIKKEESRTLWWRHIRRQFPQRTYPQLFAHWTYVLQPKLKKGRFTSDEHAVVERLLKEGKSYGQIAHIVENRSCVQIRAHFESTMQEIKIGQWKPEEEDLLLSLVEKYGTQSWKKISQEMKIRNRSQCRLKYMLLKKGGKKSKRTFREFWRPDEEKLFNELLKKYGPDFKRISAEMKSRSYNQCRYKFFRMRKKGDFHGRTSFTEDPLPKAANGRDRWTVEEEKLYTELLNKYGRNFKSISKEMKTRSYEQCRFKFFSMEKRKKKNGMGNEVNKSETNAATVKKVAKSNTVSECKKRKKELTNNKYKKKTESFESSGKKKSQKKSTSKKSDQTGHDVVAEDVAISNALTENIEQNVTKIKSKEDARIRRSRRKKPKRELAAGKDQMQENNDRISSKIIKSNTPSKSGKENKTSAAAEPSEEIQCIEIRECQKGILSKKSEKPNEESTAAEKEVLELEDNGKLAKNAVKSEISQQCKKPKLLKSVKIKNNLPKKSIQKMNQSKISSKINNFIAEKDDQSQKATLVEKPKFEEKSFSRKKWSLSEERLLEQLCQKYGHKFSKISNEMKTRSPIQCRCKYLKLKKERK